MGHVASRKETIPGFRILIRKPQGKRQLGGPRHRWDNTKMELSESGVKCGLDINGSW
jgi:hypothetical protein